jgi:hypothetical protein
VFSSPGCPASSPSPKNCPSGGPPNACGPQPPLSGQIQQLESELGVQLIDRTTHTVTPTPAGADLSRRRGRGGRWRGR